MAVKTIKTRSGKILKFSSRKKKMGAKTKMIRAPANRSTVNVGLGFPKKLVFTHKYTKTQTVTSTLGLLGTLQFRCNGLYRPDALSGTAQPYYYDQLTALYDHWCVIGSKCTFTVTPSTATTVPSVLAAYVNDDTTVTGTTPDQISESSQGRMVRHLAAANNNIQKFTLKWSARKYFGAAPLANDELKGTITADPIEQSLFVIGVAALGANTVTYMVTTQIEYITVWSELKDIAQS